MFSCLYIATVLDDGLPPHYAKFVEMTTANIEYTTTLLTICLGAIGFLGTKYYLDLAPNQRPCSAWVFIPGGLAAGALVLNGWSYFEIQDALLENRLERFGFWWGPVRLIVFLLLVSTVIVLAMAVRHFRKV